MKNRREPQPDRDRRRLLRAGAGVLGAFALGPTALGGTLARGARPAVDAAGRRRTLVLLQLSGGNDGLSTVVPHGDDGYHAAREKLRFEPSEVLQLDDYRGLHPALARLREQFDAGRLALVEGCGYPDPNRSHFKSLDIWHAADRRGRLARTGWIGRLCGAAWPEVRDPNLVVHVGRDVPFSLHSPEHPPASFFAPEGYRWAGDDPQTDAFESSAERAATSESRESGDEPSDSRVEEPKPGREGRLDFLRRVLSDAQDSSDRIRRATALYRPRVDYALNDPFALALRHVAAMIDADVGCRVFSVALEGFDTHSDQRGAHDRLMERLDRGLGAFLEDLESSQAGRDTIVLAFSEFGRRVRENGSRGTDHGVAGPMFVAGHAVRGGLYGAHPSLTDLDSGDLVHTTDFRSVYGTVVERWFGVPHADVLGAEYAPLEFLAREV